MIRIFTHFVLLLVNILCILLSISNLNDSVFQGIFICSCIASIMNISAMIANYLFINDLKSTKRRDKDE